MIKRHTLALHKDFNPNWEFYLKESNDKEVSFIRVEIFYIINTYVKIKYIICSKYYSIFLVNNLHLKKRQINNKFYVIYYIER